MSFFQDETYEKMDWLSQAISPFIFSANDVLAKMPDVIELSEKKLMAHLNLLYSTRLDVYDLLRSHLSDSRLDYSSRMMLARQYQFQCDHKQFTLSLDNDIQNDIKVCLVKQNHVIPDSEIIEHILAQISFNNRKTDSAKAVNDMLELLDNKEKFGNSVKMKKRQIVHLYQKIVRENTWQIRNADLLVNAWNWIDNYVTKGNLAALANITKLKVMTHKNQPIYSMKEIV